MKRPWQDKVALITGGSAGLGRVMAMSFAEAGAKVVIAARSSDVVAATADELCGAGLHVTGIVADVTDQQQVESLVRETIQQHGKLDVLVNNAGRSTRTNVAETTADEFQELLELNFLSVVRCTRAAMPHLIQSQGHVVNIGSLAAKTISPFSAPYTASKHAVAAYSHQLRFEGPPEVHVLLVCPGPILREDAGERYDDQASDLPASARQPGGGAKLKGICPYKLSRRIMKACQRRQPELIVPAKARALFAVSQLWPTFGDWIIRRWTK